MVGVLCQLQRLGTARCLLNIEFLMELKLVAKRFAQRVVVINQKEAFPFHHLPAFSRWLGRSAPVSSEIGAILAQIKPPRESVIQTLSDPP